MGTRIEAASTLTSHGMRKPSARRLADAAATACLAHSGRTPGDVEMLINAGIYREDNMGEPALAALIQEDIGANRGQPPIGGHGTFSFDIMNGTCGVITAIRVQSGFLRSRVVRLGMIVTSDVHPNPKKSKSPTFQPTGGAMLLSWDDNIAGFTDFHTETFPEYDNMLESHYYWKAARGPQGPGRAAGHSQLVIDQKPGYLARSVDCAEEATWRFLRRLGMGIDEIDLLVATPSSPDFLDSVTVRLGVPGDRVAYVPEHLVAAYTTGPVAALEAGFKSGRLGEARNTLMLAAGAGITVALALYRQTPP
jgi:3-oxoacyl-[acyl-carrier-protein] synthase III